MDRGPKASGAKSRGKGPAKSRGCAAPDNASCEPEPSELQSPAEDTEVAPGQAGAGAGTGGGGSRALACVPPAATRRAQERYRSLMLGPLAPGKPEVIAPRPEPEKASSFTERLRPDAVFVGTVGPVVRPKNARTGSRRGPCAKKVPGKSGSSAGRAPQATAGGQPKTGAARQCLPPGSVGEGKKMVETPPRGRPLAIGGSADTLETVQQKLEALDQQADCAYLRVLQRAGQVRLPFVEKRSGLIKSIPGFWGQALQNHPQLSLFLSSRDKEALSYLISLDVEEVGPTRLGHKITFCFAPNPYFQNKLLIKEYRCSASNQVISCSTTIQWLPGHDLHSMCQGSLDQNCSFFGWFENHGPLRSDKIAEIINEELWPNPLQYYLMSKGDCGEKAKEGKPEPAEQPGETPAPRVKPST
ncbi:testis-specific Y-encoded-like protein 5 [Octodon degus]|uniref:Testis-specific Y-encoded-like protein 5 n=1 Tax=Octodon degus TaxID=10160 RepID=A0A6P3F155_OCTDE|nr:testis-specific Y-encoded-like protein 5 [Octodon degus]